MLENLKRFLILIFLAAAIFSRAYSQKEVGISLGYEIPVDDLSWVYSPTMSIGGRYSTLMYKHKDLSQALDFGIGYQRYKPKEDVFYYVVNADEYGSITYSNYNMLQLTLTFRWIYNLKNDLQWYFGLKGGYYYVKYKYRSITQEVDLESNVVDGKGAIAPVLGVTRVFNNIGISLQGLYNIYASLGSANPSEVGYNPNAGQVNYMLSLQVGVHYKFE